MPSRMCCTDTNGRATVSPVSQVHTSVCSVITVVELTKRYNIAAMTHPADVLPLAAMAAVLYLVMSYPLSLLSARLERALRA